MAQNNNQLLKNVKTSDSNKRGSSTYGAIDLGTNNCRLLIAQEQGQSFKIIDSFSRVVRLGEGLITSGSLSSNAIQRTVEALKICEKKIRLNKVQLLRNIATEACRQAKNGDYFLDLVKNKTGLKLEIIQPLEEAQLILAGCLPLINPKIKNSIIFDIGGGSTEVMWIVKDSKGNQHLKDMISIPLGVVSLSEKFNKNFLSIENYQWVVDYITNELKIFDKKNKILKHVISGNTQMLGTSGTVTTLTGIHLNLKHYKRSMVDGLNIDFIDIFSVISKVKEMDFKSLCAHPCIGQERADLIIMGCAILNSICQFWPVGQLRVADRGIREGILSALIANNRTYKDIKVAL